MEEIKGILNICRKAGYLIIGGEKIEEHTQKMFLILVDSKAGKSLLREMNFIANSRKIPIYMIDDLENIIGIFNCKAVAIKNKNLSESILKTIKGE